MLMQGSIFILIIFTKEKSRKRSPRTRSFFASMPLHSFVDADIGLRFVEWMMRDAEDSIAKEFKHAFNSTVTYNITTDKTNALRVPRFIAVQGLF